MKNIVLFTVAAAMTFLSACENQPDKKRNALSNPKSVTPTVAVVPFTYHKSKSMKPGERGMREFESIYFPSRVVQQLQGTGGLGLAYYSPVGTPATDLTLKGTVNTSDGRNTSVGITLERADGTTAWSRSFGVTTPAKKYRFDSDPTRKIWSDIAAAVAKTPQIPGRYSQARIDGYTKNKTLKITDNRDRIANEGANVERTRVLQVYTDNLLKKAAIPEVKQKYVYWQAQSAGFIEARSAARTKAVISGVGMVLNTTLAVTAAVASGYAAGMTGTAPDPRISTAGAQLISTSAANLEVSMAQVTELNRAIEQLNLSGSMLSTQPISVVLYQRTYNLTGSLQNQLSSLHNIVAQKIKETE